jgi:hypothetical protein
VARGRVGQRDEAILQLFWERHVTEEATWGNGRCIVAPERRGEYQGKPDDLGFLCSARPVSLSD